jgi:hypothetical protein
MRLSQSTKGSSGRHTKAQRSKTSFIVDAEQKLPLGQNTGFVLPVSGAGVLAELHQTPCPTDPATSRGEYRSSGG